MPGEKIGGSDSGAMKGEVDQMMGVGEKQSRSNGGGIERVCRSNCGSKVDQMVQDERRRSDE